MQIKFQRALIAGGSRGLGRQIAVKLASEDVKKIAVHYRTGMSDVETTLFFDEDEVLAARSETISINPGARSWNSTNQCCRD